MPSRRNGVCSRREEDEIEGGIQHEWMDAVDQSERAYYRGRGVTSAHATLFGAMREFPSERLRTVGTARLQRFVAVCQQVDSPRGVVLARVFDPGGLRHVIVRCCCRFWESSWLSDHALYCT